MMTTYYISDIKDIIPLKFEQIVRTGEIFKDEGRVDDIYVTNEADISRVKFWWPNSNVIVGKLPITEKVVLYIE